jgi:hypothetical protein
LAFLYDINWIRDREVIMDVFVLDPIFLDMVHVDSDNLVNGGVVEGRYSSVEFHIECPRFSAVECCIHGDGKEDELLQPCVGS